MAVESPSTRTVRLRLISEAAPPKVYDSRPTEFGLKDKKRLLHPGLELADGTVQFDLEVQVQTIGPLGTLRFYGPFVLGKTDEQYIGLVWGHADELKAIRGQKIRLDTLAGKMIDSVTRRTPGILQTKVVPVTERTGTVPVDWTVVTDASTGTRTG